MIEKTVLERVLARAMSTGADFAEVFVDYTRNNSIKMVDGKVDAILDDTVSGVGIRAFMGLRSVASSTTDLTEEGLLRCADNVAGAISESRAEVSIHLVQSIPTDIHRIVRVPDTEFKSVKVDLIRRAYETAKSYSKYIAHASVSLLDVDHNIQIANSDGLLISDRQIRTRMYVSSIAENGDKRSSGSASPGRRMGLELYDMITPEEIGREASRSAMVKLDAAYCPAGKMTVAIENGFGGVIFHESCGHSLEATSVAKGMSQMCGKLGQQIANPKVSAVDDGTIPNAWGSINIDDEGTPSRRNLLIENGILKAYMVDKLNGRRMGMEPTGNSRRESYVYEPTSRMTNTMILNGPDRNEDIIASMDYGLYASKMGGGSVNPLTGAFNFAVEEGYMVRDGKICEAVKGASLIGTGSEILQQIDMVGQNLLTGQGMCGSVSGSIPTDVGQPLIRVASITVGGRS